MKASTNFDIQLDNGDVVHRHLNQLVKRYPDSPSSEIVVEEPVVLEQPHQQSDIIPGSAAPSEAVSSSVTSADGGLAVAVNSPVAVGREVVDVVDRSPQSLGPRRSARVSRPAERLEL